MPPDLEESKVPDFPGLNLSIDRNAFAGRVTKNVSLDKLKRVIKRPGFQRVNQRHYNGAVIVINDLGRMCDYGRRLVLSGPIFNWDSEIPIFEHNGDLYIDPNYGPIACFTVTDNGDGTFTFDASCSWDPDGAIVSYAWDFGDGDTGSGIIVTHDYGAHHPAYTVNLTVTDTNGLTDTDSAEIEAVLELAICGSNVTPEPVIYSYDGGLTPWREGAAAFSLIPNLSRIEQLYKHSDGRYMATAYFSAVPFPRLVTSNIGGTVWTVAFTPPGTFGTDTGQYVDDTVQMFNENSQSFRLSNDWFVSNTQVLYTTLSAQFAAPAENACALYRNSAGAYKLIVGTYLSGVRNSLYSYDLDVATLVLSNEILIASPPAANDRLSPIAAWLDSLDRACVLAKYYDVSEVGNDRYKVQVYRQEGAVWVLKSTDQNLASFSAGNRAYSVLGGKVIARTRSNVWVSDGSGILGKYPDDGTTISRWACFDPDGNPIFIYTSGDRRLMRSTDDGVTYVQVDSWAQAALWPRLVEGLD